MMMLDIVSIKMLLIFVISYIILLFVIAISSNNDQCWHVAFTFQIFTWIFKGEMCNFCASNVTKRNCKIESVLTWLYIGTGSL